jgi:hypothetical protein
MYISKNTGMQRPAVLGLKLWVVKSVNSCPIRADVVGLGINSHLYDVRLLGEC